MSVRFNAPPGWPVPSSSWQPDDGWLPDPSWPAPPRGWTFWSVVDDRGPSGALAAARFRDALAGPAAYGTDRTRWLDSLRELAATLPGTPARSVDPVHGDATQTPNPEFADSQTASDHLEVGGNQGLAPVHQRPGLGDTDWELDGLLVPAGVADR